MPRGVKRGPEGVVAEQQASQKEKRLSRFRAQPSKDIVARIERALSQRLFLVGRQVSPQLQSFAVLGSTGNVYDVVISQTPSCTCPDHAKGNLCKHILFVFLRVLRLSRDNPLVWQTALLASEVHDILRDAPAMMSRAPLASAAVRSTYSQVSGVKSEGLSPAAETSGVVRKPFEGMPCPICFEDMHEAAGSGACAKAEETVWCKATCGQSLHALCWRQYARHKESGANWTPATCPYCRSPWQMLGAADNGAGSAARTGPDGYLNLGRLQAASSSVGASQL